MVRSRDALFVVALVLECLAVWIGHLGDVSGSLVLHSCSAAGIALGPGRALVHGRMGWLLPFVLAIFLPVWGAVGVWVAARFGEVTTPQLHPRWIRMAIPGAEEASVIAFRPPQVHTLTPSHRDPVPVLRRALRNPDEDQRLMAHAILESKSRDAYRAVHEADCKLRGAPEGRRAAHHLRLAACHFELVRLGLAEGDCLDAALEQARKHACAALDDAPQNRSAHFLLGRVELQQGRADEAQAALVRAVQLGLPDAIARPYLAEAAFLRGRLDLVRGHLRSMPTHSNAVVERVKRYWA